MTRFSQHKRDTREKCIKLVRAFNKHGRDNFIIESILVAHTQDVLDYWETHFIKKYNAVANGYNCREGGSRGKHSMESRRKMSEVRKGIKLSDETKKRIKMNNRASEFDIRKKMSTSTAIKTTLSDIREIKRLSRSGVTQGKIAAQFGVCQSYISKIVNDARRNF